MDAPPDAEALAAMGLRWEGPAEAVFGIFPQNWKAWRVFESCLTQWRRTVLPNGATVIDGLDNTAVRATMEMLGIRRARWSKVLRKVQILEDAALDALNRR